MSCTNCEGPSDSGAVEVTHRGTVIGRLCEGCQTNVMGAKLVVRRNSSSELFQLAEYFPFLIKED